MSNARFEMSTLSDENQMVAFNVKYASRGSREGRHSESTSSAKTHARHHLISVRTSAENPNRSPLHVYEARRGLNSMSRARLITRAVRCICIYGTVILFGHRHNGRRAERTDGRAEDEAVTRGRHIRGLIRENQPPRIHLSSTSWHDAEENGGVSLATPPPGTEHRSYVYTCVRL